MSTDITSLSGTITYTHHVHDLNSNLKTVVNSKLDEKSVSGGFDNSYISSNSGGCFTEPYYSYTSITSTPCSAGISNFSVYKAGQRDDEWGHTVYFCYAKCNVCGGTSTTYSSYTPNNERELRARIGQGTWSLPHTTVKTSSQGKGTAAQIPSNATNVSIIGYKCSCGYTNGQVLSATIAY